MCNFTLPDSLMIADDNIRNIQIEDVEWIFLPKYQGLVDVCHIIDNGKWTRDDVKNCSLYYWKGYICIKCA